MIKLINMKMINFSKKILILLILSFFLCISLSTSSLRKKTSFFLTQEEEEKENEEDHIDHFCLLKHNLLILFIIIIFIFLAFLLAFFILKKEEDKFLFKNPTNNIKKLKKRREEKEEEEREREREIEREEQEREEQEKREKKEKIRIKEEKIKKQQAKLEKKGRIKKSEPKRIKRDEENEDEKEIDLLIYNGFEDRMVIMKKNKSTGKISYYPFILNDDLTFKFNKKIYSLTPEQKNKILSEKDYMVKFSDLREIMIIDENEKKLDDIYDYYCGDDFNIFKQVKEIRAHENDYFPIETKTFFYAKESDSKEKKVDIEKNYEDENTYYFYYNDIPYIFSKEKLFEEERKIIEKKPIERKKETPYIYYGGINNDFLIKENDNKFYSVDIPSDIKDLYEIKFNKKSYFIKSKTIDYLKEDRKNKFFLYKSPKIEEGGYYFDEYTYRQYCGDDFSFEYDKEKKKNIIIKIKESNEKEEVDFFENENDQENKTYYFQYDKKYFYISQKRFESIKEKEKEEEEEDEDDDD